MKQSRWMSLVETATRQIVVLIAAGFFTIWWFDEVDSFWYGLWKSWPFVLGAFVIGYVVRRGFERLA